MTRDELRALARQIVVERIRQRSGETTPAPVPVTTWSDHSSHAVYLTIVNPSDSCVIEPGVQCTHCNYCKSYGH